MTELFPPESVASLPGRLAQARIKLEQLRRERDRIVEMDLDDETLRAWTRVQDALGFQEAVVNRFERLEREAIQ